MEINECKRINNIEKNGKKLWSNFPAYLVFLLSLAAFPANSRTSAAKYSITAAK